MGLIGGFLGLVFGILLTRIFLSAMTAMSGYKVTYILPLIAILTQILKFMTCDALISDVFHFYFKFVITGLSGYDFVKETLNEKGQENRKRAGRCQYDEAPPKILGT